MSSGSLPPMMVLCTSCGDAVEADAPCVTCGEAEPQDPAAHLIDQGALLDRVEVALAAQAELATKTAALRTATAFVLYDESVVLRTRLRRQVALMRRMVAERRELQASLRGPVGRLDRALAEPPAYASGAEWAVRVLLPRDVSCGAVARRVLEDHLNGGFDRQAVADAMLVTSALAFNALLHGSGRIELRAELQDGRLRVEVSDEGEPDWIGVAGRVDARVGGTGLWLVGQLSSRWGASTRPARVWAELPLTRSERYGA